VKLRLDLSTSMLITGAVSADIRQCEMCTWFFIDASFTKRRRWCSMALLRQPPPRFNATIIEIERMATRSANDHRTPFATLELGSGIPL